MREYAFIHIRLADCLLIQCEMRLAFWDPIAAQAVLCSCPWVRKHLSLLSTPQVNNRLLGYNLRCFNRVVLGD